MRRVDGLFVTASIRVWILVGIGAVLIGDDHESALWVTAIGRDE